MIAAIAPAANARKAAPVLDLDEIIERHRRAWIADAGAYLRVLDWRHLAGKQLAIIDFDDVPDMPPQRCYGFASPVGLFELLRPHMKAGALAPGPAMMIGTAKIAAIMLAGGILDRITEATAAAIIRLTVNAVAMHEYAHAIDFEARGVELPAGTTLASIFAFDPTAKQARRSHSAGWLRAYAHLLKRSAALPCHDDHYLDRFRADVEAVGLGTADEYLDALQDDFEEHGHDRPLVEVLRTPAPAGFITIFDERGAARSANEET